MSGFQLLTIFRKSFILKVLLGSKHVPESSMEICWNNGTLNE